jgi:hypothetical protein
MVTAIMGRSLTEASSYFLNALLFILERMLSTRSNGRASRGKDRDADAQKKSVLRGSGGIGREERMRN